METVEPVAVAAATAHEIVALYKRYIPRCRRKDLAPLLSGLLNYDYRDLDTLQRSCLDLYKIAPRYDRLRLFLHSNTGHNYTFGPNGRQIVKAIETHLNGCGRTIFFGFNAYHDIITENVISLRFGRAGLIPDLIDALKTKHDNRPVVIPPGCLLYLSKSDEFIDLYSKHITHENRWIISTDDPAFVDLDIFRDRGIFVNDKMINWRTGLNFFTCTAGHKHFLPIFAREGNRYYNLLNPMGRRGHPVDDLFEITGSPTRCTCGLMRIDFRFIPHVKSCPRIDGQYLYDTALAKRLKKQYYNYQIIQVGSNLHLYYVARDEPEDAGLKFTRIHKGFIGRIGRKRPAFWKCGDMNRQPLNPKSYMSCVEFTTFDVSGLIGYPTHL